MKMEERLRNSVRQGVFGVLFLFFHRGSGKDSSEKGWEGICSGQSMKKPSTAWQDAPSSGQVVSVCLW